MSIADTTDVYKFVQIQLKFGRCVEINERRKFKKLTEWRKKKKTKPKDKIYAQVDHISQRDNQTELPAVVHYY